MHIFISQSSMRAIYVLWVPTTLNLRPTTKEKREITSHLRKATWQWNTTNVTWNLQAFDAQKTKRTHFIFSFVLNANKWILQNEERPPSESANIFEGGARPGISLAAFLPMKQCQFSFRMTTTELHSKQDSIKFNRFSYLKWLKTWLSSP